MENNMSALVQKLKENDCDFEYYPTTQKMVECIYLHIGENRSILDIGCGRGDFCTKIKEIEEKKETYNRCTFRFYGFEKSPVLIDQLPDYVTLLGTDFDEQTLIDKEVDTVFCNPPYSKYEDWAERIIRESWARCIFLILPERWQRSEKISKALRDRKMTTSVLMSDDFFEAERKARAKVDVIKISHEPKTYTNPFDLWFDSTFSLIADNMEDRRETSFDTEVEAKFETDLVQTENVAEQLVSFYNADMERIFHNYKQLESLDKELFKELKVNVNGLKEALKERLKGLRRIYWNKLLKSYSKITSRLTAKTRNMVMGKVEKNKEIDFTLNNIFAVTLWIIKNANKLYDEQLCTFFRDITCLEAIKAYKSNRHWKLDDWKCCKASWRIVNGVTEGKISHYTLDYRIIISGYGRNFVTDWSGGESLDDTCAAFIQDIICIAQNLGFDVVNPLCVGRNNWEYSADGWNNKDILYANGKTFCNVKLYKNGNKHLKFDTEFMKKLNVEASRLLGWVNCKEDLAEETDLNAADVSRYWNSNAKIGIADGLKIVGIEAPKE